MKLNVTDIIICWVIAVVELTAVITYVVLQTRALRRKIVGLGRLISTLQTVVIAGGIPPNQMIQMPSATPQNVHIYTQPQPSAPGFYQSQDNPPAYSTVTQDQK